MIPRPSPRLDRAQQRAVPRFTVALAAAGCFVIVAGVFALGTDPLGGDDVTGGAAKIPGLLLSLVVTAAGLAAVQRGPSPPVRTAGVVASALGIPATLLFLTYDGDALPPISFDVVLLASALGWGALYLRGPGRGRLFYLGTALVGAWLTVLQLLENVFSFPFEAAGGFFNSLFGAFDSTEVVTPPIVRVPSFTVPPGGLTPDFTVPDFPTQPIPRRVELRIPNVPDPNTIAFISILFGIGYLYAARRFDRAGAHGRATPFSFAGVLALFAGIVVLAFDVESAGAGILFAIRGRRRRRGRGIGGAPGHDVGRRHRGRRRHVDRRRRPRRREPHTVRRARAACRGRHHRGRCTHSLSRPASQPTTS